MPPFSPFGSHGPHSMSLRTAKDRVEQFRSQHRIGEQIAGRFSQWAGRGLGWVEFPGGPLLASMSSRPDPGTRLHFLVKQLFPEIVLQEIIPRDTPGIMDLLQGFWVEQSRLETRLIQLVSPSDKGMPDFRAMKEAFRQALQRDSEIERELQELTLRVQAINTELAQRGLGRFYYLPWLAGHVRCAGLILPASQEAMHASKPSTPAEALFICMHPVFGNMEIYLAMSRMPPGFAVHLEHVEHQSSLTSWLDQWFSRSRHADLDFLGARPLPGELPYGALARLLLPHASDRLGLHIQV